MTQWDRINAMQLELVSLEATVRRSIAEVTDAQIELINVKALLEEAIESRDLARRVAMRLEEENAALAGSVCALCDQVLVPVPVLGEAT